MHLGSIFMITSSQCYIALVVVVPKAKVEIKGPTKSWAGIGSSGKAVHRIFCSECGSPIAHDPDSAPDIIAMKGGTLDMEIKRKLKPVSAHKDKSSGFLLMNGTGHRDLDRVKAALL
jgi:hypothetical protein